MKTKLIAVLCVAILAVSFVLTSCGKQREFEKVDPNATTETTTETTTEEETTEDPDAEKLTFAAGIQMGMSIREVQDRIGVHLQPKLVDGRKNLAVEFSGTFINDTTEKTVQFMFDQRSEKLEQWQFQCNTDVDGANATGAVTLFDLRYGKSAISYGKYENHIWYHGGTFIMISVVDDNNYVVTYTEREYFKKYRSEEYQFYQDTIKEPISTVE